MIRFASRTCCLPILLLFSEAFVQAESSWRYQSDVTGLRPVTRSIRLTGKPPQDLREEVPYRGKQQRYAQLRYGSENSRRVTIVVDDLEDGSFAVYVDTDRNRRITRGDLVSGSGRSRTCELETEIIRSDERINASRKVQMRLGATRTRLSVATLGCVGGKVELKHPETGETQSLVVRRIDGNANGLFADSRDRLLIDLNADGKWDRVTEQFANLPVLKLLGGRFAVRSDRLGRQFSLVPVTGIGKLRVVVASIPKEATVTAFEAMVFSSDGSAYALKELNQPLSVPTGSYTLGSITMTIDTGEGEPWHFVFSRNGRVRGKDWVKVAHQTNVALEAIGKTRFVLDVNQNGAPAPGDVVTVNPRLYTHDGLLINLSCRGRQIGSFDSERSHNRCQIRLQSASGSTLSAAKSGFA